MATISDSDFLAWLADDRYTTPILLIIAEHAAGTKYISNRGYCTATTDTPANQYFEDLIVGEITISESMSEVAFGSVYIADDGSTDDWLDLVWTGYSFKAYLGDARWKFSNFRLVADMLNAGLTSPDKDRLKYEFYDKSAALLSEEIGGEDSPVLFGQVINIPAKLIDSATLLYKLHSGIIVKNGYDIIRDNGIVLTDVTHYQMDEANGEFTLLTSPVGQVTADIRTFREDPMRIIIDIATAGTSYIGGQLLDVDDALLPTPDNIGSTLMSGYADCNVSVVSDGGQYVVNLDCGTDTPSGAYADVDLSDLVSGGLVAGDTIIVSGEFKHDGVGSSEAAAKWFLRYSRPSPYDAYGDTITPIYKTDTSYKPFRIGFVYGVSNTTLQIRAGGGEGSVYIKNLQAYKSVIQVDTDSIIAIPSQQLIYQLGYFSPGPVKIGEILDYVVGGMGAFYRINSEGKLAVSIMTEPAAGGLALTTDDFEENGLTLLSTEPPIHQITLKHSHNWKVQPVDSLAASVSLDDRETWSREWQELTAENSLTDYPVVKSETYETSITDSSYASTEITRRAAIRAVPRRTYLGKSTLAPGQVAIGDSVNVTYPKYSLDAGVDLLVIGIDRTLPRGIELILWG